jgi:hypothetical protein
LVSGIKGVFENIMLRRIFGPKRDKVTGGWRILHNEELGMYHEWGRRGMHVGYWGESQKVRDLWEDQDVGGRTILKWVLERNGGMIWI